MDLAEDPGSPAFVDAQEEQEASDLFPVSGADPVGALQSSVHKEVPSKQKHAEVFIAGLAREAVAEDVFRRFAEVGEIAEVRLRVDEDGEMLSSSYFTFLKSSLAPWTHSRASPSTH